ncbi:hypothetical protein SAMN05216411_11841 [Nitrosospira multiformis]|nr:hypothetical protein SAMN05216411_11841 [Nitrosospira multiformis]
MREDVLSHPRLIEVLKKMQEVSMSRPQPYEIKGDQSHMIITRRRPLPAEAQARLGEPFLKKKKT